MSMTFLSYCYYCLIKLFSYYSEGGLLDRFDSKDPCYARNDIIKCKCIPNVTLNTNR